MAKGYPDWAFPFSLWAGRSREAFYSSLDVFPGTVTLASVTGKGQIQAGWIHSWFGFNIDLITLNMDGQDILRYGFSGLWDRGLDAPGAYTIFLTTYDTTNDYYGVALWGPLAFEESFEVKYTSQKNGNITIEASIIYTLM